ncbi:hypothetical protein OIU78_017630 [Salix suchowensis]|nr:hypothetical protein OIU78_017630 [Salix suchowensis]
MKALKDDNVNMIGLYGMGGVGKTTLVKEIGRRAKESQLFDVVLLATVSQNPNVMYMQDRMAESLDLCIDEKTTEGRANRLWQRLKTEKKLLVILDDVWKVVNLKEIGIPVGDDHRGCKVLLTSRDKDICSSMECQPLVFLSILSENEAWALFKINAGLRDEDSNLNTVAKKVARKCQGLPIALVTVGRALRGKSIDGWEVASTKLKNSQLQNMERNEDYHIPIEDLTRYTVGYGIHQDVESIEDARKQVYVEIKTLKDCCMLLGTETEEDVKMHDLVRLKNMVSWDVTGCKSLRRIPVNLIGRLKKLEELLFGVYSFKGWGVVGCDSTGGMNASLTELNLLSHLVVLSLRIPRVECIPRDFVFPRLLKYDIMLGTFIFTLSLAQSLVHLETLKIYDCSGLKHLIGEKDDEREIIPESLGFPKLKTLCISYCDKLEYVFPVSVGCKFFGPKNFTAQFPSLELLSINGHEELGDLLAQLQGHKNLREICITDCKGAHDLMLAGHELSLLSLEKLELTSMPDMRCIWKGLVLSHLTSLKVHYCKKLTHVFTGSMVASLVQLESLDIFDCEELEQIIAMDNDDASPINVEKQMVLPNLSFLRLGYLPSIVCFSLGCDDLSFPCLGNPRV